MFNIRDPFSSSDFPLLIIAWRIWNKLDIFLLCKGNKSSSDDVIGLKMLSLVKIRSIRLKAPLVCLWFCIIWSINLAGLISKLIVSKKELMRRKFHAYLKGDQYFQAKFPNWSNYPHKTSQKIAPKAPIKLEIPRFHHQFPSTCQN